MSEWQPIEIALWGKYPFTTRYEMVGMDGPNRHIVMDADGNLLADFGGRPGGRDLRPQDAAANEQSRKRARAFCDWLNSLWQISDETPTADVNLISEDYL
jgi:hypothetical protein